MSLKDKNSEISILHILPLLQSTKIQVHEKRVTKSTFAIIEQIPIILRTCFHIEKESFHWII